VLGFPARTTAADAVFLTAAPHARPDARRAKARAEAVASDGMQLVHLLASSMRVDQSLASAVRFAAAHAGGVASEELERLEWAVRLRHFASIDEGFLAFAEACGRADGELKRALVTIHGAEGESTREGLERRLDRAYDIVVRAEERRREKLAGSLERPVQTLFGAAVVLPLVLAALVPMLQVGGGSVGPIPTAVLLIGAVPIATVVAAERLLARNFLGTPVAKLDARRAAFAALAAPACAAAGYAAAAMAALPFAGAPIWAAGVAAAGGFAAGRALEGRASPGGASRADLARDLPDLLHSVGTRMAAGRPAEHALLETVEAGRDAGLPKRLRGVLFDVIIGRRSLAEAVERDEDLRGAPRVLPALRLLASTAERDTEASGRVVLHLAEFERLRAEAAASLRTKLKALVETTRVTVVVFAPMILGITAGMYGLLARVGAGLGPGSAAASAGSATAFAGVVVAYLAIEVALSAWFAARLASDRPIADFGRALARDVPTSLALFAASFVGNAALF
jgi:hypothetical protein